MRVTANNNGSTIRVAPGASLDEHLFVAIDGDLDGNLGTNLNVPVSASTSNTNDYEYYFLQNCLGSVMGLLDATDDRYMLEYYRYTVYGEATVLPLYDTGLNQIEDTPTDLSDNNSAMLATRTGGGGDATAGRASTFNNQYTFTGRYLDTETGLHYYRFRYYESRTGRFISRDPAETPWTNTYSYCENIPTNSIDPMGLQMEPARQAELKRLGPKPALMPHRVGVLLNNLATQHAILSKLFYDACVEGCAECPPECCRKVADILSAKIYLAMLSRLLSNQQTEFGDEGNARREYEKKYEGKDDPTDPGQLCNCGSWQHLIYSAYLELDPKKILGDCPACCFPTRTLATRYWQTGVTAHEWMEFNWGTKTVAVDPWIKGYASGDIASPWYWFGGATNRATASHPKA